MEQEQSTYWVGRYRLSARIATGGMAEVYLGRRIDEDGRRGPAVAVKRLMPHLASDRRVVQMFLNEARITAQVRHPNVVTILELGMEGTEPFIAMELLEGRSFAELRQEAAEHGQRVPLGITLRVLVDACRGLDAAHRAVDEAGRPLRIVHRDFTPDNVHVGVNGAVKVIDFGIAKADALGSGTEPGVLKGKFFYMSPEMIAGRPVDHRADLFAAGVMLYEQLCGRRPFTGLTAEEVLGRIAEGRPKPPTAFDPSVPAALELVCLTALAREPAARFDSLESFIDAIEAIGGAAEVATHEQLAAYVDTLFPPDTDSKRQALRRARLADPSHGSTPPGIIRPVLGMAGAPADWTGGAQAPNPYGMGPSMAPGAHGPEGAAAHPGTAAPEWGPPPHGAQSPAGTAAHAGGMGQAPGAQGPAPHAGEAEAAMTPGSAGAKGEGRMKPGAAGAKGAAQPARAGNSGVGPGGRKPSRLGAILGGVLVVGALGGGAAWFFMRPAPPPAERLAKAEAAATPEAKVSALDGLGTDARATAKELARAGALLMEAGAHTQALALAESFVSRFPKDVQAHLLAARAATELRMGKRAERAIEEATTLAPRDLQPLLALAELRERQGDVPGALAALAKAHALRPRSSDVTPRYGRLLSQSGRLDEAAAVLAAWTRDHDDAESLAELGFVRFRQERVDDAASLLRRAIRKDARLSVAHYYLGAVLFRQGDTAAAERSYVEADRLAPEDPRALTARCQLHAHTGNTAAVNEVKRVLAERFPGRASTLVAECSAGK
ncbi:protein kinase [Myxococcus sp. RHSTA-1-4]|uniref:protein kinase domain-containing protein n=1 Tax=Myxococcus sp. RHSTA-1-4 TaxID=2874601 RepID=UPI001CBF965D|nr:protein kinase [Myxococcus sp. RHSTA-1-4]MBZ4419400.1 protein kinase [Myxococcus sp. RHSTA-1-4]